MTVKRVLAIGLDGATFDVLRPLMDAGRMPNLRAICDNGSFGRLRSTVPPLTAPAWSSFMTGVNPGKHGVFQFFANKNKSGPRVASDSVVNSSAVRAPAFWKFLNDAGLRVGLMNVPMTYPPPEVDGFVVAGMPAPITPTSLTYPRSLQERLPGYRIDLPYFLGGREFQAAYAPSSPKVLSDLAALFQERSRYAIDLMRDEAWDFFMVVFTETDRLGHYLWGSHLTPNRATPEHDVASWYKQLDDVIGDVVKAAGEDTALLMMSDHGMGAAATRRVYFNDWLRSEGYLTLASSRSNINSWLLKLGLSRDRLAKVASILPQRLVQPLVRRAAQVEVPLDFKATRAYFEPVYEFVGGIRIVESGAGYDALRSELTEKLSELSDPATGQRIVQSIHRREEVYSGELAADAPDLIVILQPEFAGNHRVGNEAMVTDRVELATSASIEGAHRMEGIFVAHGIDLRSTGQELYGLRIEDLAPTIIHMFGLPVPASMDGRVIEEIFSPAQLAARPVSVKEYDLNVSEEQQGFSPTEEREVRRQLEGLGYIN